MGKCSASRYLKPQVARETTETARRTHLHQVANGSKTSAAENLLPSASLAPRARARKRSARSARSLVSQVARSLADDLGSIDTVPFGCLLLSLPVRAALGVPFWRGFLGDSFQVHVY